VRAARFADQPPPRSSSLRPFALNEMSWSSRPLRVAHPAVGGARDRRQDGVVDRDLLAVHHLLQAEDDVRRS